jgi:hypothetical protein
LLLILLLHSPFRESRDRSICSVVRLLINFVGFRDRYTIQSRHITSDPDLTPEEIAERDRSLKHNYYQSVWWGSERIWSGELVRLMTDNNSVDVSAGSERSPGSEDRGTFLRVTALFKDSKLSKAFVTGVLYELREDNNSMMMVDIVDDIDENGPPMPTPPVGYSYRRITAANVREIQCEIEYIAGRVYPLPLSLDTSEQIAGALLRSKAVTTEAANQWGSASNPVVVEKEVAEENTRRLVLSGLLPSYMLFMRVSSLFLIVLFGFLLMSAIAV